MKKTAEQILLIKANEGMKNTRASAEVLENGDVKICIISEILEVENQIGTILQNFDEIFPIIDPSELIGHKLLEHKPKTEKQEKLLAKICEGIERKLPAFRAAYMDPSEENGQIVFKPGNKPAVGHSPVWWEETLQKLIPNKNSRMGTDLHWAAFLGKQMKYLIQKREYSVEKAWEAVCDDSCNLGHYYNSKHARLYFEPTGSRKIGEFFDLANTTKIIKDSKGTDTLLLAGGCCNVHSRRNPLSDIGIITNKDGCYQSSVGWHILDV